MKIKLENIGKRFNRQWIFQGIDLCLEAQTCLAITGGNGSGKSTLLQIISGYMSPSAGGISWNHLDKKISTHDIYRYTTWATPYVNVYDEFSLRENVEFFLQFKKLQGGVGVEQFAQKVALENEIDKPLKHFSSGMRQRVKLGLAIIADTPLLLLDEPTSHLDAKNTKWFQQLLLEHRQHRTICIASNNATDEIFCCDSTIEMERWKR